MPNRTLLILAALAPLRALGATLEVGPGHPFAAPCAAIAAAGAGDTIEIDAAGSYSGDVCGWLTGGLTIVGVNGRPKIDAGGQSSGGKAIWVISGDDTVVDNVELSGASVADLNGAGIRQEGKNLTVRRCYFHDNQDGILAGDKPGSTIVIEYSEFADNGAGDGMSHNLYINHVDQLVFRYNYSHHAKVGHLLKTRALTNRILYNRFSDEATGTASYEINVPNAGTTFVIGNVIEQGPMTQNPAIVDYGSEPTGFNPTSDLYLVNNTVINDRPAGGTFVQVSAMVTTPVTLTNNIFFGPGTVSNQASAVVTANYTGASPLFAAAATYDYHLLPGSPCADAGHDPGAAGGMSLVPDHQYVHPAMSEGRMLVGTIDIGAYELGGGVALPDGGAAIIDQGTDGSSGTDGGSGRGGCACQLAAQGSAPTRWLIVFGLVLLLRARRDRPALSCRHGSDQPARFHEDRGCRGRRLAAPVWLRNAARRLLQRR